VKVARRKLWSGVTLGGRSARAARRAHKNLDQLVLAYSRLVPKALVRGYSPTCVSKMGGVVCSSKRVINQPKARMYACYEKKR